MATSDQMLEALDKIAPNYETSPEEDELEDAPNFHYSLLQVLGGIEYNLRIYNEMYRTKNAIRTRTSSD